VVYVTSVLAQIGDPGCTVNVGVGVAAVVNAGVLTETVAGHPVAVATLVILTTFALPLFDKEAVVNVPLPLAKTMDAVVDPIVLVPLTL